MREVGKIAICLLFLVIVNGCKKNIQRNTTGAEIQISQNLDFINYPIDDLEGITSTRYDGIYRNFDYKYRNGEAIFFLFLKLELKSGILNKLINNLSSG